MTMSEGAAQLAHQRMSVVAGAGIEGDCYFGRDEVPRQNLTLVEAEEIEGFPHCTSTGGPTTCRSAAATSSSGGCG